MNSPSSSPKNSNDHDTVIAFAMRQNEPLPLSAYKGLCSRAHFYKRYFPAGLKSVRIDGRRCVRPTDFFAIRNNPEEK